MPTSGPRQRARGRHPGVVQPTEEIAMKQKLQRLASLAARRAAAVSAGALVLAGTAHAELPADVSTAITAYKTDALAAIAMLMAAGVAIWGLMKLASKMGWR